MSDKKVSQLIYNEQTDRYELNGYGLHCGDCFEVLVFSEEINDFKWFETSIESNWETGWYLTGSLKYQSIGGLYAREIR